MYTLGRRQNEDGSDHGGDASGKQRETMTEREKDAYRRAWRTQ